MMENLITFFVFIIIIINIVSRLRKAAKPKAPAGPAKKPSLFEILQQAARDFESGAGEETGPAPGRPPDLTWARILGTAPTPPGPEPAPPPEPATVDKAPQIIIPEPSEAPRPRPKRPGIRKTPEPLVTVHPEPDASVSSLRKAVIWSEILAPPVAFREDRQA